MNSDKNTPRLLGAAFLLQAVAALVWGEFLLWPLIVSNSIAGTMSNISHNALQMRASIMVAMITAIGIVMIGVLMYVILKKQNRNIAIVAMGLYLLEAAILAVSRIPAFSLLHLSQESVIAGHPAHMRTLGNLFLESAEFGVWLHMLPFALGATMFYYLFFKSRYIPRALSLFGLIAASLALIGTSFVLLGYDFPLIVIFPNLPFELAIGVWLMVKGIRDTDYAYTGNGDKKSGFSLQKQG